MGDFFDKAKVFATDAIDKTGDMVEIGKYKAKIASKKNEIEKLQKKIGRHMYEVVKETQEPESIDPEILDMCRAIDATYDEISILEDKVEAVKGE